MAKELITKQEISDVMIERPISFSIKGKHYSIFPATLGKIQLFSRLLNAAGLGDTADVALVYSRFLEAAQQHRGECLRILTYFSLEDDKCLYENIVLRRMKEFNCIEDVDLASLILAGISLEKSELVIKQLGIDVEAEQMKRIVNVKKNDKNSVSFGERSIWGALIDAACQRYGWSYQYVLWGISYSNLRIMLADQSRTVFLSDMERKQVHVSNDRNIIRAEDTETLNTLIKNQSWK